MALMAACVSNMTDTPRWTGWNPTYQSIANNQLSISPPASTSAYYPVTNPKSFDLTGSSAFIKLVQRTNAGNGASETQFVLQKDANNSLSFNISAAIIVPRLTVAGTQNNNGYLTYNSTLHRWLRIRELNGTIYWDIAPDSTYGTPGTWVNIKTLANPFAVTALNVQLVAGCYNTGETSPGTAIFSNLNLPTPTMFFQ